MLEHGCSLRLSFEGEEFRVVHWDLRVALLSQSDVVYLHESEMRLLFWNHHV